MDQIKYTSVMFAKSQTVHFGDELGANFVPNNPKRSYSIHNEQDISGIKRSVLDCYPSQANEAERNVVTQKKWGTAGR